MINIIYVKLKYCVTYTTHSFLNKNIWLKYSHVFNISEGCRLYTYSIFFKMLNLLISLNFNTCLYYTYSFWNIVDIFDFGLCITCLYKCDYTIYAMYIDTSYMIGIYNYNYVIFYFFMKIPSNFVWYLIWRSFTTENDIISSQITVYVLGLYKLQCICLLCSNSILKYNLEN